jgi:hypothetical protein
MKKNIYLKTAVGKPQMARNYCIAGIIYNTLCKIMSRRIHLKLYQTGLNQ